jgi:hypothetical protein
MTKAYTGTTERLECPHDVWTLYHEGDSTVWNTYTERWYKRCRRCDAEIDVPREAIEFFDTGVMPCGHAVSDLVGDPPFCGPCEEAAIEATGDYEDCNCGGIVSAFDELRAAVNGQYDGVDVDAYVRAVRGGPPYIMPDGSVIE